MVDVNVDYTGFQIPDEFVVGYGLDYDQKFTHKKTAAFEHTDQMNLSAGIISGNLFANLLNSLINKTMTVAGRGLKENAEADSETEKAAYTIVPPVVVVILS